jgi:PilZ domain-containing protein
MSDVATKQPRRSSRVFLKMRLKAQGRDHDGRKFRETCETLVVSAHGALILLKHEMENGEMIVLTHPETQEEQECRVVYLGEPSERQRVGVEFLTPAPRFWGVELEESPVSSGLN